MIKATTAAVLAAVLVIAGFFTARLLYPGTSQHAQEQQTLGVSGPTGVTVIASTTAYTISGTPQRIVATSSKRTAVEVDNIYCTAGGTLFLRDANDAPAIAKGGPAVLASTSRPFVPGHIVLSNSAIQAVVDNGTCTANVTEYRTAF